MADDEKLTQKTETASASLSADIMEIVTDYLGTPLTQWITPGNLLNGGGITVVGTVVTGNVDAVVTKTSASDINTGTDTTKSVDSDSLAGSNIGRKMFGWTHTVSASVVTTGDGTNGIAIPIELNGWNIIDVLCSVHDKGITGATDVQIRRRRAGSDVDVLSTKVTIGNEFFARDGVINASNDDLATGDILYPDVDAIHSGTSPNGLSITITAGLP